jgi:serine/threonine protein kinase
MGPYELLEQIGRGGMGTVYRGRHRTNGQVVAVKVMASEAAADPVMLQRFEQEFRAANRLDHPHIIRGLDFGVEHGQPYLVMEYVQGQNLTQRVKDQGPCPLALALRLFLQLSDALHTAHSHQLIHRDVKPENILLTLDGQAKLGDLGLIKDLGQEGNVTRSRTCLGTLVFMAPEQFEDAKRANARSDVYSLGATLYYALTGLLPFQGRGQLTILKKKLHNDFVPPARAVPDLPPAVDAVICRSLDPAPKQRPATCEEFAAPLREVLQACAPVVRVTLAPPAPPPAAERRVAPRFRSDQEASCRPAHQQSARPWAAAIQDASTTGLRLHVGRRFEVGTVLAVEVVDEADADASAQWFARVCWVREVGPNTWGMGCVFNRPLAEDELNLLLGGTTTIVVPPAVPR